MIVFVCLSIQAVSAQNSTQSSQDNIKKHNFGIGISAPLTSSTNQNNKYICNNVSGTKYTKVDKNLDLNISLLYEYNLNKNITIGIAPTYRFGRTELEGSHIPDYSNDYESFDEPETMSDLDIPVFCDYKIRIMDNMKSFFGIGFSGMFNLSSNTTILRRETFSPYLNFRLGMEMSGKHRIQFLLQYRCNLSGKTYYDYKPQAIVRTYPKDYFQVHTFDVGVNFFF